MADPLKDEVCVVTGANSGIGREVAVGLMRQGAHVVMACRNMTACSEVQQRLSSQIPQGTCSCQRIELDKFDTVRAFAAALSQQLRKEGRSLKVLVNNAGVMGVPAGPDGQDAHLVANHLGPYLLTRLLLPAMKAGSRVVNVSSRAHYQGSLSIKEGQIVDQPSSWFGQYARSKLCNTLFTQELARRVQQCGITTSSVSPGLVNTNIFSGLPGALKWLLRPAMPYVGRTPEKGAETVLYAATAAELEAKGVLFLHDCKEKDPSVAAKDPELAAQLWDVSERLVGLKPGEGL